MKQTAWGGVFDESAFWLVTPFPRAILSKELEKAHERSLKKVDEKTGLVITVDEQTGEELVENDGSCEGQVDSHELYLPMRLEEL